VLHSAHGFFSFIYSVFLSLLCRHSRAAIQQVHGYPTATAATQRRTLGNLFAFAATTLLTVFLQVSASAAVARVSCSQFPPTSLLSLRMQCLFVRISCSLTLHD
jgi:hypothetical protein